MTDPDKLTLNDWQRTLRAERKSARTIQSYLESAQQLAAFLASRTDLLSASTGDIRDFMAWLADRRSAATCSIRYRALQQLYKWALTEDLIPASPMDRMRAPRVPDK